MRLGILTGGGDCPGLNAVIRAAVVRTIRTYEGQILGFLDGRLGGVLAYAIERRTGIETRTVTPGCVQRGGAPSAFDRPLGIARVFSG